MKLLLLQLKFMADGKIGKFYSTTSFLVITPVWVFTRTK